MIMQNIEIFSLMLFISGTLGFVIHNKHVMNMLIMLEFMMLGFLLMLCVYIGALISEWLVMIIIFFLVCESVIGISSVILVSRSHGKEEINSLVLLKC